MAIYRYPILRALSSHRLNRIVGVGIVQQKNATQAVNADAVADVCKQSSQTTSHINLVAWNLSLSRSRSE